MRCHQSINSEARTDHEPADTSRASAPPGPDRAMSQYSGDRLALGAPARDGEPQINHVTTQHYEHHRRRLTL